MKERYYSAQEAGALPVDQCNTATKSVSGISGSVCTDEPSSSVVKRLHLVSQRAESLRNSSMNILAGVLQQPGDSQKERAGRVGLEGQLRDVQEALEDAERTLQVLGNYLFA
jgi:hypothetical protein